MDKDTYSNVMEEKPGMTFSQAYSAKVATIIIRPGFLHHHHSQLSSSKGCRSSGYCAYHLWVDSASSKHNRNHVSSPCQSPVRASMDISGAVQASPWQLEFGAPSSLLRPALLA